MSSKTFRTVNNSYFCTIFKSEKLQRLICAYWVCFAPGSTARHPFFCFHNTSRDVPPWGTWLKTQHCWRKVGKDRKKTKRPNSNPRPPVYKACALPLCYNHGPKVLLFPFQLKCQNDKLNSCTRDLRRRLRSGQSQIHLLVDERADLTAKVQWADYFLPPDGFCPKSKPGPDPMRKFPA